MSENSAESQVPSESAIDLSTTHIILLGLGGVFGLLLGVAVLALAYYCHRKNKLKDKEKGDQVTVLSCDECVGAATLRKNTGTAGTVVLDMDQISSSCQHGHSPRIDDMSILRQNKASSTKSPADSTRNNHNDFSTYSSLNSPIDSPSVDSPPNSLVNSPSNNPVDSFSHNSVDSTPNSTVDSPPNNSVHSLPNTPVDSTPNNLVDSPPNTPVNSPPNNSVDSLPITPVDSPPNNSIDSPPNNSIDSPPNNSVNSLPNTPVDSTPNNSVDSTPNTPVDSPPNNSVDSPPNNSVDSPPNDSVNSLPNTPEDSTPNNSVDSLPITPVDSPQNNSVDSPINTHLDSPQNNSVESLGDLSHPEAISPNISNQTCETVAVSPHNFEDVEAKEMPEPIVVLPNREACQEGYLSLTKDEETPCKEDGYIRELKGDGDLICQDTMTKNNLDVKDTEKEMNVLSEVQILQEKVRALEQQNAVLIKAQSPWEIHGDEKEKTFRDKDAHSRSLNEGLNSIVGSFKTEDMNLIDVDSLEREGGTWLMTINRGQVKEGLEIPVGELKGNTPICGSPMEGLEWLRRESGVSEDLAASRNTLVNRLNGLANAFMLPAWIQGDGPPLKQTNDVYSSQDSHRKDMLPDDTLNSHPSKAPDLRRTMPNLNKTKCRGAARPQYSLSQNQNHNSETRLQRPSHLQAAESQRVHRGAMGAPTCPLNSRGRPAPGGGKLQSGLRPSSEGLARKSSLPARPSGTSMPSYTGPSGTSRSSSTKLPSGTRPSSNGPSSRSSSTKLPSGTRPSSNGPSGTSSSSSIRMPSGTRPSSMGLAAPSARRGLGRGNIGGTRVS